MGKIKIIGVTGARRAGKDTFANLVKESRFATCEIMGLTKKNTLHYAFADMLKHDLEPLFHEKFCVDILTMDGPIKETLRPILIAYGCAWRDLDPLHWVKEVDSSIKLWKDISDNQIVHIIKDVRFPNEVSYFKEKYGEEFMLVSIERNGGPEPTDEEKKNIPLIEPLIDYRIIWDTEPELIKAKALVDEFCKKFLNG